MIGYYNYSVILTYIGLASAVYGMIQAMSYNPRVAILCLMICGLCDAFDGAIARTCKRTEDEKSFGMQIDSLCDLICFGVFPAIIGYGLGIRSTGGYLCMFFYILATVIRLGYFNVQEMNRVQQEGEAKRKYYTGLPVTNVSLLIPCFILLDIFTKRSFIRLYNIALLLIGMAFLSKIKVRKLYLHGLIVVACLSSIVFLLIFRYGGNIICLPVSTTPV